MCVFCDLIKKEPHKFVYSDDSAVAFVPLNPAAPIHFLVVPRRHMDSLNAAATSEELGHLLQVVKILAAQNFLDATGYRTVINSGEDARQTVKHLHIHLLGGKDLGDL